LADRDRGVGLDQPVEGSALPEAISASIRKSLTLVPEATV